RGLGPALLGIHTRPGENWSLARLARTAAMSRSTFAERFSHVLGVSPARYVLEFRMREAKRLLLDPSLTIPAIAARLGMLPKPLSAVPQADHRKPSWAT
ncbi:MAG: helix-turn-helix transcriptional regulator, partial [Mesorhizobium sp.]